MGLIIDVFVSSPGDMVEEREAVAKVVAELADKAHVRRWCALRAQFYERMVPPILAPSAQDAVNTYMMDPARCDVLVCMLGDRLGTPLQEPKGKKRIFRSGTEYELVTAYESSKHPSPRIIMYVRDPRPPSDAAARKTYEVERRRVDDLVNEIVAPVLPLHGVNEIVAPVSPLHGMKPASFGDLAAFSTQLAKDLDEVITGLVRWYQVRLTASIIAGAVLFAAAVAASAASGRWREAKRGDAELTTARVAHAREVIELAMATAGNDPSAWDSVRGIDHLGCAAIAPLSRALVEAETRADLVGGPAAIVDAMAGLARKPGLACGCRALLGVLAGTDLAAHCKGTHRIVLDALTTLPCRDDAGVVDKYLGELGKNDPEGTFHKLMCQSEAFDAADLRDLLRRACRLPHREVGQCARTQAPP